MEIRRVNNGYIVRQQGDIVSEIETVHTDLLSIVETLFHTFRRTMPKALEDLVAER